MALLLHFRLAFLHVFLMGVLGLGPWSFPDIIMLSSIFLLHTPWIGCNALYSERPHSSSAFSDGRFRSVGLQKRLFWTCIL